MFKGVITKNGIVNKYEARLASPSKLIFVVFLNGEERFYIQINFILGYNKSETKKLLRSTIRKEISKKL